MKEFNYKQFTNKEYLSKKEVMYKMGHNIFNEKVWQEIIEYRRLYSTIVKFENAPNEWSYIVQTPPLITHEAKAMSELASLQNKVYQKVMMAIDSKIKINDLKNTNLSKQITLILKDENHLINNSTVLDLINNKREAKNETEELAFRIYRAFRKIEQEQISPKEINKILTNVSGGLRTSNIEFINETTNQKEMIGYDKAQINDVYKNIELVYNSDDIMPLMKSAINYFVINNGIIFDDKGELTSILMFYSLISKMGFKNIAPLLNFVEVIKKFESNFKKSFSNAKKYGGDLTYIYVTMIDLLKHSIRETHNNIEDNVITVKESNYSIREQTLNAKDIVSRHPGITMKQAMFFINHSERDRSYTINDFKDFCRTSYETSRYSMDKLVQFGYYKKIKMGKKFIYNLGI